MTTTGKRAARRAQRREDVLEAAMRIILDEGLGALTIQRLAKETGASVGGLYRYYESKEAVMAALQLRAIGVFGEVLRRELELAAGASLARATKGAPKGAEALFRVAVAVTSYLRFARGEPERHRLFDAFLSAQQAMLPDAVAAEVDAAIQPLVGVIAETFDEAVAAGALATGDGAQRTYVVWAATHGLDHFRKRDRILPPTLRVSALLPELLHATLTGWGASDKATRQALAWLSSFEHERAAAAPAPAIA